MALSAIVDQNFHKKMRKEQDKKADLEAFIHSMEKSADRRRTVGHSPHSIAGDDETAEQSKRRDSVYRLAK